MHEGMLKDAGNCACDLWPRATHQRRSSLTSSLAEANGKHCNTRLLRAFQAPLLRNVWFMGYVSFLKEARPTCVDVKIPTREKGFVLNIILGTSCFTCLLVELRKRVVVWLLAKMKLVRGGTAPAMKGRNSWCSRRSTVVKEGFPVFMVALIKLLIQSYGKLIQDVLLIVEMGGEAVEDEDLAVGVPHVRSVNGQGQTNIRSWRLGSCSYDPKYCFGGAVVL